jgi:hypothetical protein
MHTSHCDEDRWTVRVWLPLYNVLAMLGGIIAYLIGSPLLNRLFTPTVIDGGAVAFFVSAILALIGVCVPSLWRLELIGKIGISFLLTTYAFLVLTFSPYGSPNNAFITVILIMATWGVYPRLTRLFIRGLREKAERKGGLG